MEIKGTIIKVGEVQTFKNDFTKKSIVLKTDDQYPQVLEITFVKDNIRKIDTIKVGNEATIAINVRGREWVSPQGETKYFTSLEGWQVTYHDKTEPTQPEPSKPQPVADIDDDLPF